ncbi:MULTISPECIES: response regulator transcription factor [unclassified Lentimicrobium]|uniref:response regulator n=1 Tax=unclassified Lentimicrobium TaxID=2677434 RepID=UPI0015528BF4|nr:MULTISPECIES: response regulator transcription factor [unclassified Lentimicrobium]NPD45395.1 response regulator transcription factor [Lentimicrobium sp. S6]NPD86867.1 response regulator transcription factor [Lentimicrobium sp. L6]
MNKIKIILVDDHQLVRDGIKSLISDSFGIDIIGEASNSVELFKQLHQVMPDVILMDISLPNMSGIEITKILKKDYPKIKILMLSMYTSEDFIFNGLKAGINGYLPKNTTRDELLLAIEEVHNGREYFSKSISNIILKSFVNSAKYGNNANDDKMSILTKRETEILKLVVEGVSNQHIADQLFISIRTVETHKTSIMKKLELNNTIDLVKFAIKNKIIEL